MTRPSLLGYVIFKEMPGLVVLIGAFVLLIGVAISIFGTQDKFRN